MMTIKEIEETQNPLQNSPTPITARVSAVHRELFELTCARGTILARLKGGTYYFGGCQFPTVGDYVTAEWQTQGEGRILSTLPRKTYFARRDPSADHTEQAVAANFDTVFLIQSLDQNFNPRRLERYLALAWQSGAIPVVVLTKADQVQDVVPYLRAAQAVAVGVDIHAVSAKTGQGLERLSEYIQAGQTVVCLGSSGVGKSTLVNALAGDTRMATQSTREKDGRGRHTTSHRQLITLAGGGVLIDTPGMREVGLCNVQEGLSQSFGDVEAYFGGCKFSDCTHQQEPGCAIHGAIAQGALSQERWESYCKLQVEGQFAQDKAGYLREKELRFKGIAKLLRTKGE